MGSSGRRSKLSPEPNSFWTAGSRESALSKKRLRRHHTTYSLVFIHAHHLPRGGRKCPVEELSRGCQRSVNKLLDLVVMMKHMSTKRNASDPDEVRRIPVFVVIPPRLLLLDIAGPLEVLRQANRLQKAVRFEVRYIGPNSSLLTSIGIALSGVEPLPEKLPPQCWVVLAGDVEHVMLSGGAPGPGKSADD